MLIIIATDIVIRKIFVAKRSHAPRNDRFLFVEQSVYKSNSIYKVYTYSLFNVWPGVNMYNRKSVARAENPLLSFHVVDRVVSGRGWKDGRAMYPVFAMGMMEMI